MATPQATLGWVILIKKPGQTDPSFDRAYTPAAFFSWAMDKAVAGIEDSKSLKKFAGNILSNVREFVKEIRDETGVSPSPSVLCILYASKQDAEKAIGELPELLDLKDDIEIKPVLVSFTSVQ